MRRMTAAATILMLAGCTGGVVDGGDNNATSGASPTGGPHAMPMHKKGSGTGSTSAGVSSSPQLTYRGGPVLANVKIETVFWNSQVQDQTQLNQFYGAVTNSAYFDWLSEYNTSTQQIGRGSFIGSVTASFSGGAISDGQIQQSLASLIDGGQAAAPDGNTLYMIHFPAGSSISMGGGDTSCQTFCAYHGSFSHNGTNVFYGVLPDVGADGCENGCGSNPTVFQNTTEVASHEMIEAVTDADVGQGDLAWYDDNYGEIGDICNGSAGTAAGYTVQTEWSNSQGQCVDHVGASNNPPPNNPPPNNPPPNNPPPNNLPPNNPPPPPSGGNDLVQNGGFEDGAFGGWSTGGVTFERTVGPHSGTYCARVGSLSAYSGDSWIAQTIAIPASGTTTLTFWYEGFTSDTIDYDSQSALLADASGNVIGTMLDVCEQSGTWKQAAFDLTPYAGQTVQLYFGAHDDGWAGDPTYLLVDDVSVVNQ